VIPSGQCWYGSPSRPAPADYDYRPLAPVAASSLRRIRYGAARLLALLAIVGPLEAVTSVTLLSHPHWVEQLPVIDVPAIAAAARPAS
jgi:hypothetical protein